MATAMNHPTTGAPGVWLSTEEYEADGMLDPAKLIKLVNLSVKLAEALAAHRNEDDIALLAEFKELIDGHERRDLDTHGSIHEDSEGDTPAL